MVVVAPVEQLPETFGFGGYEDLAGFVQKYQRQVNDPGFEFKDAPEDYLIYVEKVPFQMFASEPAMLSFATLTDSTYRNYRSPAGRASLESRCYAALRELSRQPLQCDDLLRRQRTAHLPYSHPAKAPPLALPKLDGRLLSFKLTKYRPEGGTSDPTGFSIKSVLSVVKVFVSTDKTRTKRRRFTEGSRSSALPREWGVNGTPPDKRSGPHPSAWN